MSLLIRTSMLHLACFLRLLDQCSSCQFLSTGHDFSAQVWEIPENGKPGKRAAAPRMIRKCEHQPFSGLVLSPSRVHVVCFDDVPQDIVYKHDNSVLAIPCTDG